MKRFVIVLGLSLIVLGVSAQRPMPRIAMFAQFDNHLTSAPFRMYGPDGSKLDAQRLHNGLNLWKAMIADEDLVYGNAPQPALGFFISMPMIPVAAKVSCAYERSAFTMTYPGETKSLLHVSNGIKPEFELYYVFTNPISFFRPSLMLGGAYHCPISYYIDGNKADIAALNKGFEVSAGFSFLFIPAVEGGYSENRQGYSLEVYSSSKNAYAELGLLYKYALFNYFNQNYVNEGSMPYAGFQSKYGEICLRLVVGGFFQSKSQRISSL